MDASRTRGWIYVLTNAAMPGLVKIGRSGKDPTERADQLGGTSHPEAFVVQYDALVIGYGELETAVHTRLEAARHLGSGRGSEFFACSALEAVDAIREVCGAQILLENVSLRLQGDFDNRRRAAEEKEELLRLREDNELLRQELRARTESSPVRTAGIQETAATQVPAEIIMVALAKPPEKKREMPRPADLEVAATKKESGITTVVCPKCGKSHLFIFPHFGAIECSRCKCLFKK